MGAKKQFRVTIPTSGIISVEVEAEDKEAAVAAAWKVIDETPTEKLDHEWEFHEKLVDGNVFSGMQARLEVEEAD